MNGLRPCHENHLYLHPVNDDITLIWLRNQGTSPGFSKRLFESLAFENVNVILITQSSSEHSICVGINDNDVHKAKSAVDKAFENEISSGKVEPLSIENDLSIIAVVGDKMKATRVSAAICLEHWEEMGLISVPLHRALPKEIFPPLFQLPM